MDRNTVSLRQKQIYIGKRDAKSVVVSFSGKYPTKSEATVDSHISFRIHYIADRCSLMSSRLNCHMVHFILCILMRDMSIKRTHRGVRVNLLIII